MVNIEIIKKYAKIVFIKGQCGSLTSRFQNFRRSVVRSFKRLFVLALVFGLFSGFISAAEPKPSGKPETQEQKCVFACAINCMDGRCDECVKKFIMDRCPGVNIVDMPTGAGPNKLIAENSNKEVVAYIVGHEVIKTSVNEHGSKLVAIVGHCHCAGNNATKEVQIQQLRKAKEVVKSFGLPEDVEVILLWVEGDFTYPNGEKHVEEIK